MVFVLLVILTQGLLHRQKSGPDGQLNRLKCWTKKTMPERLFGTIFYLHSMGGVAPTL